jgi:hypothetical protein
LPLLHRRRTKPSAFGKYKSERLNTTAQREFIAARAIAAANVSLGYCGYYVMRIEQFCHSYILAQIFYPVKPLTRNQHGENTMSMVLVVLELERWMRLSVPLSKLF